ncbi:Flp pilus assembly protein CpaB [Methylocella silvestris BL2]|uniref:Flp pilus assembly protein CpaB n=1 Tax=Methylocella silvestris (strain DSM 15510 / CIP 108128 / LMG 27833 / NCIMB 13906 / BL2) TaxID=395965 RepID=B8ERR4_METSB|nr:Flp pilus assembly protein CpaB [Methylocella silvestris]ACK51612.1 Flp pilus assembly protein CpaB [Methylocella silvestris BL2]
MLFRKLLIVLGAVFVIAGVGLCIAWVGQLRNREIEVASPAAAPAASEQAILSATRAIPAGELLRSDDIGWKNVGAAGVQAGNLLRGQVAETEFFGAITRRDFAAGEGLIASDLVKPNDRRFLAAVLKPGRRALSVSVDAAQSAAGLVLPGDYVDVILTQDFGDKIDIGRRTVSETVLWNVRVIAVDQSLDAQTSTVAEHTALGAESHIPKTVTLEMFERQAETLLVAAQLGKFQLAVRPLVGSGDVKIEDQHIAKPLWASDVSPALKRFAAAPPPLARTEPPQPPPAPLPCEKSAAGPLECSVRRPPPALSRYHPPAAAPGGIPQSPSEAPPREAHNE